MALTLSTTPSRIPTGNGPTGVSPEAGPSILETPLSLNPFSALQAIAAAAILALEESRLPDFEAVAE